MANLTSEEELCALTVEELRERLTGLGLPSTGSRAVLRERLRGVDGSESNHTNDEVLTKRNVDAMRKAELVSRLRDLSLNTSGKKEDLRNRLKSALEIQDEGSEQEDEEEHQVGGTTARRDDEDQNTFDTSSEDDAVQTTNRRTNRSRRVRSQPTLTFRDVEDALEKFSGDGNQNFQRWVTAFEETAELCEWTEIQKVIYVKRLLRGPAKLFANYECEAKSWKKLRKALSEEFSTVTNSKQVHYQLSQVKKKSNESYHEYIYRVLDIASNTNMELDAKIQYIIDGVQDSKANKAVLYGATTIKDLRKKFSHYEALVKNSEISQHEKHKSQVNDKMIRGSSSNESTQNKRCYNCGDSKHFGKNCPNKSKGAKCFSCGEYGHIAPKCPTREKKTANSVQNKVRCDAVMKGDKKSYKLITVQGKEVEAMIDSGSDLHLVRSSFYFELNAPTLKPGSVSFGSVGPNSGKTLGSFNADIVIDDIMLQLQIHIVPDEFISHNILIGGELSDLVEIRMKRGEVKCIKLEDKLESECGDHSSTEVSYKEVLNINIQHEEFNASSLTQNIKDLSLRKIVDDLISNYKPKGTKDSGVTMRILLKDEIPVYQNPRRLSTGDNDIVNMIILDWLKKKIIKESVAEYASPVVLTMRKSGKPRLCTDYRILNKHILRDRFPLPLIEDLLDRLQGATVFSTIDLEDGFFHVKIDEDCTKYTAFVVPDGHYEFLRAPFGLCNSPAVFQRHIRAVFKSLLSKGEILIYLDDIVIPSKSAEDNVKKLKEVLELASSYGLKINWKKCTLVVTKVEYLGYIIENGTVKPSEAKTKAVMHFPKPQSSKEIHSFIGLTGYFRKFIPNYATIARPLTNLLKDNIPFIFGAEEEKAFNELKMTLSKEPILKLYKAGSETELHTDASRIGLGAILFQKDAEDQLMHPIFYASWKTSSAEEKYTSYELEILVVIKSLKKFEIYLRGIPFKIVTDCRAFVQTMQKKDSCLRVARWALLIEEFQYTIEHRPGTSLKHVDALSRHPISICFIQEKQDGLIYQIKKAQEKDENLLKIIKAVKNKSDENFTLERGILYREDKGNTLLVIPKSMEYEILKQAHDNGHFGLRKMEHSIRQEFWFPNLRNKIQTHIENCIKCILLERKQGKAEGFHNPINKGDRPLDTYHVDHLGPIPSTKKKYNHLLVVTDAFSKFCWIYPTKSTTAEETIQRLKNQAVIFGNPRRIISDRGTAFTSGAFRDYCKSENIEQVLITTGIPRGNGQVERMNRVIIPVLSKLSENNPADWYKFIDQLQQNINSSFNRSVGKTPFEIMIGTNMRLKDDIKLRSLLEKEFIEIFQKERSALRDEAVTNIQKIQQENRKTVNSKRKVSNIYKEGDLVAIQRTQGGPGLKLRSKFLGPYKITSVLRNDRYLVEKIGNQEGPIRTSTSADNMKRWPGKNNLNVTSDSEDDID